MKIVPKKTLIVKLAEACDAVGGVEKKGRNEFQRYNYVKAADIAKAVRHELFSRGILTIIDEKEWIKIAEIPTNSGNLIALMQLRAEVSFRDETEILGPIQAFATAMDSGDKAIYKAKTGLLKYVLRGIGLIPDEKDDPEFDEGVDEQTDPRVMEVPSRAERKKKVQLKDFQVRAWDAACHSSGKTAEQVAQFLQARYSVSTVTDLPAEEFKAAIRWATGVEDLENTLRTSVEAKKKAQPIVAVMERQIDDEVATED
jgi:hypothetical protein